MRKFFSGLRLRLVVAAAIVGAAFVPFPTPLVLADYLGTVPGSGTNFASIGITVSAVLAQYSAFLLCDATAGKAQCAAVDSSGNVSVSLKGATNNINNIAGTVSLPTGAATASNQSSQITQETSINTVLGTTADAANCATSNTSISCLRQIDADVKAPANIAALATGGCTPGTILSAASNNSTSIKSSATGTLCELTILQTTTTLMDVRLYDVAGAPTCSSATGVVANYVVQSNAISPGMAIPLGPFGKAFVNGIGICITGANANNDNTNAATGLNVSYSYK